MPAYSEAYLDEVVETQGRLFDYIAYKYPDMDTKEFIESYMNSKTRHYIDVSQAYEVLKITSSSLSISVKSINIS